MVEFSYTGTWSKTPETEDEFDLRLMDEAEAEGDEEPIKDIFEVVKGDKTT